MDIFSSCPLISRILIHSYGSLPNFSYNGIIFIFTSKPWRLHLVMYCWFVSLGFVVQIRNISAVIIYYGSLMPESTVHAEAYYVKPLYRWFVLGCIHYQEHYSFKMPHEAISAQQMFDSTVLQGESSGSMKIHTKFWLVLHRYIFLWMNKQQGMWEFAHHRALS